MTIEEFVSGLVRRREDVAAVLALLAVRPDAVLLIEGLPIPEVRLVVSDAEPAVSLSIDAAAAGRRYKGARRKGYHRFDGPTPKPADTSGFPIDAATPLTDQT